MRQRVLACGMRQQRAVAVPLGMLLIIAFGSETGGQAQ